MKSFLERLGLIPRKAEETVLTKIVPSRVESEDDFPIYRGDMELASDEELYRLAAIVTIGEENLKPMTVKFREVRISDVSRREKQAIEDAKLGNDTLRRVLIIEATKKESNCIAFSEEQAKEVLSAANRIKIERARAMLGNSGEIIEKYEIRPGDIEALVDVTNTEKLRVYKHNHPWF